MPAFILPIYNPDLFWHLSAGRWIAQNHIVPREDFLSFTMPGAPWSDFEWLSQLLFHWTHQLGGLPALWALKVLLLALTARLFLLTLSLYGLPFLHRAAALVLWSLAALARSDIRPELFSILFFSTLILALEAYRLQSLRLHRLRLSPAAFFTVFALWANLHAGFIFGLLLLICVTAAEVLMRKSWRLLGLCTSAAAAGALCTPYGVGPYVISAEHWFGRSGMTAYIQEWHPMTLGNAFHWPFWLVLGLLSAALARCRRSLAPGLLLAAVVLGANSILHARLAAYFHALALPLVFSLTAGWAVTPRLRRAALAGALVVAGLLLWTLPSLAWSGFFDLRHVPMRAAAFMEEERSSVEGLRLYNEWEWGGYLAWRLPWHKVFWDGRYIFHERLAQGGEAAREPDSWQAFMEKQGLEGALVLNRVAPFPTQRLYADGTRRVFLRPWYLQYLPRSNWALVYWDEKTLFFVRRGAVPAEWLKAHEYRYLLPRDEDAFADALGRGEIPAAPLAEENQRHRAELSRAL